MDHFVDIALLKSVKIIVEDDTVTDLLDRLRLVPRTVSTAGKNGVHCLVGEWCFEAAERIAELERQLAEERAGHSECLKIIPKLRGENMRMDLRVATLERALREARNALADYAVPAPAPRADVVHRIDAALAAPVAPAKPRDPRCTCLLVRRSIVPEEHDDSCPVVYPIGKVPNA